MKDWHISYESLEHVYISCMAWHEVGPVWLTVVTEDTLVAFKQALVKIYFEIKRHSHDREREREIYR